MPCRIRRVLVLVAMTWTNFLPLLGRRYKSTISRRDSEIEKRIRMKTRCGRIDLDIKIQLFYGITDLRSDANCHRTTCDHSRVDSNVPVRESQFTIELADNYEEVESFHLVRRNCVQRIEYEAVYNTRNSIYICSRLTMLSILSATESVCSICVSSHRNIELG